MTDNTSPVATLSAKLPKGNGLTRAVDRLHGNNGAYFYFVGCGRVDESGEDLNDVLKIKTSMQRFDLCAGELERDAKDLLARASYAANAYPGQMSLIAEPGSLAAQQEDRERFLGYLKEWQTEQGLSDAELGEQWTNFHDGSYGPTYTDANPAYLLEFLKTVGALPDEPAGAAVDDPPFSDGTDDPGDDGSEPDDEAA